MFHRVLSRPQFTSISSLEEMDFGAVHGASASCVLSDKVLTQWLCLDNMLSYSLLKEDIFTVLLHWTINS